MALTGILADLTDKLQFKDDGIETVTSREQIKIEASVLKNYQIFKEASDLQPKIILFRDRHTTYLKKGLRGVSESYECLDASRPWLVYWITHSLELLNEPMSQDDAKKIAIFLGKCQDKNGGFAGGPGQLPHLAPTFAAVCALCILGRYCKEAYNIIDRGKLQSFLLERRTAEGSFTMHKDGEVDIRGVYCAIVAARLTNIVIKELFEGTADWLIRCQTYEGGFSGMPEHEAHGGYTFCGFAALALLGQEQKADIKKLLKWVANRQMRFEGGFQGRTNKLVDGCYSFWQGGLFPVIHSVLQMYGDEDLNEEWMFDQAALQEYVLVNCQYYNGGLLDKPGKARDFYHTCYCLSGLSIAQNIERDDGRKTTVVGEKKNLLEPTHPAYNICTTSAYGALEYFSNYPISTSHGQIVEDNLESAATNATSCSLS